MLALEGAAEPLVKTMLVTSGRRQEAGTVICRSTWQRFKGGSQGPRANAPQGKDCQYDQEKDTFPYICLCFSEHRMLKH